MANKTIGQLNPMTPTSATVLAGFDTTNSSTGQVSIGDILKTEVDGYNLFNGAKNSLDTNLFSSLTGIKNLIPFPGTQESGSQTEISNVTFTCNEDGSYTVNGTASQDIEYVFNTSINWTSVFPAGQYILTGCPAGGSDSTYQLVAQMRDGEESVSFVDNGEGDTKSFSDSMSLEQDIKIVIYTDTTVQNLTFYPMLRPATIEDNTFEKGKGVLIPGDDGQETEEVAFPSFDTEVSPSEPIYMDFLTGLESWSQRFTKVSQAFRNIRYILKKLGNTDISTIGNGTLTGAISTLNDKFYVKSYSVTPTTNSSVSPFSAYAELSIAEDVATFGSIVGIRVTGGLSANPVVVKTNNNADAFWVYAKSADTPVTIRVLFMK